MRNFLKVVFDGVISIFSWAVAIGVVLCVWVALGLDASATEQPELSSGQCVDDIKKRGACCVSIQGVVQVITPDGDAVKVVVMPEHLKPGMCRELNSWEEA